MIVIFFKKQKALHQIHIEHVLFSWFSFILNLIEVLEANQNLLQKSSLNVCEESCIMSCNI